MTVRLLLEGAIIEAADHSEANANEALLCEHVCLVDEVRVQAARLAPMHVVNWEDAQGADTVLAACRKWLKAHKDTPAKRRDALLKKYLGSQADMEEGHTLFCICNSLVLSKGLLYISTTPKGELEGVLKEQYLKPLCLIRPHAPLELVHVDFTSVESTMELNKSSSIKNILVITDHFMCYALVVVTKDQMAKTVAKVLYERFIVVFGMLAKLLSDRGANFTSALVQQLCTMFGIQKYRTTAYHPQCNGQVEHFHQTLFRMIGKLASDKKVQWEQHLPELLQAYNSTRSAITGYSPHYLMFGRHPCLPVDFYFPTKGAHVCSCHVPAHVEEVRKHFKEAYTEAHLQTNSEVDWQKGYYDRAKY